MKLTHRTQETLASVTEQFAEDCYQHNQGCVQSIKSHKVMPVLPGDNTQIESPYLDKRQGNTNTFIENFTRQ